MKKSKMALNLIVLSLVFILVSISGCKMDDSDNKWQSFSITGRLISSGFNSWTCEYSFDNYSSDRVLLTYQYARGKDQHGLTEYTSNQKIILQNGNYTFRLTSYDFSVYFANTMLHCYVGTYNGGDLSIDITTGHIVFRDKE